MEPRGEGVELKVLKAKGLLSWALGFFGGGAGITLGYAAIQAVKARPDFLQQLLSGGALWFASLVIGMVIFRRQLEVFNAMQLRHVIAQEKLAQNVGELVTRDDQRAREQDLLLNHLARNSDEILRQLAELRNAHGGE
jgi:hypothetical protein